MMNSTKILQRPFNCFCSPCSLFEIRTKSSAHDKWAAIVSEMQIITCFVRYSPRSVRPKQCCTRISTLINAQLVGSRWTEHVVAFDFKVSFPIKASKRIDEFTVVSLFQ